MFFALWPDDISRQRCVGIINSVRTDSDKPVQMANLHITLVFLGNISKQKQGALQEAASQIKMPELAINFNRLSFWKKAGILCLTAAESYPELIQLAEDLASQARNLNIKVDERAFKPHITLIRNARKLTELSFEPVIWRAHAFCLAQSQPLPDQGSKYDVIKQWPAYAGSP